MLGFKKLKGYDGSLIPLRRIAKMSSSRAEAQIRLRTDYAYVSDGLGICRVLGRFKMYVDPLDIGHSSHLILDGAWELWITRFLISKIREGSVVVDVGANLGYFTVLMAELVGPHGAVHAFEPNIVVADRLAKTIIVNGFSKVVTLHQVAVGSGSSDLVKLVVPTGLPSGAWLVPVDAVEDGQSVSVRCLDDFPELAKASVIKIDAEGYEYEAWRGMRKCVAGGHPMLILIEFAKGRYAKAGDFLDEICESGFQLSVIGGDGIVRNVKKEDILEWPDAREEMLVLER